MLTSPVSPGRRRTLPRPLLAPTFSTCGCSIRASHRSREWPECPMRGFAAPPHRKFDILGSPSESVDDSRLWQSCRNVPAEPGRQKSRNPVAVLRRLAQPAQDRDCSRSTKAEGRQGARSLLGDAVIVAGARLTRTRGGPAAASANGGNAMTCSTTWARGAPAPGALISNLRQHREVPMRRKHCRQKLARQLCDRCRPAVPDRSGCAQEVVDFRTFGEQNGPALTVGSLTVTGSANWFMPTCLTLAVGCRSWASGRRSDFRLIPRRHGHFLFRKSGLKRGNQSLLSSDRAHSVPVRLRALDASGSSVPEVTATVSSDGICLDISAALNVGPISRVEHHRSRHRHRCQQRVVRHADVDVSTIVDDSDGDGVGGRRSTTARTSPIPIRPTPTATASVTCASATSMRTGSIDDVDNCGDDPNPTRRTPTATARAMPAIGRRRRRRAGRRRQLPAHSEPGSGGRRQRRRRRCLR